MNIVAVLNPLYTDLLDIGFEQLMSDAQFNRVTNTLDLTGVYADAFNEVQEEKSKDQYAWLVAADEPNKDILKLFLNKLYDNPLPQFAEKMVALLENAIPLLNYVPGVTHLVKDLASIGIDTNYQERVMKAWQKHDFDYNRKVSCLYQLVRTRARNVGVNESHYKLLRADIIRHHALKDVVPEYIVKHPQIDGFWQFIKGQGGYRDREAFIDSTFEPLLQSAQQVLNVTQEHLFAKANPNVDMVFISQDWKKALNRLKDDPEVAITSARSLLETVCKYILDMSAVTYDEGTDLPSLYKLTAKQLNLSPETHTEPIFKQILSGCVSIVGGLGSLRNKHSDAHGKRLTSIRPSARHAELAVNISGAMSSFMLQTFEFRNIK